MMIQDPHKEQSNTLFTGLIRQESLPAYPLMIAFRFPAEECFDNLLDLFLSSLPNIFTPTTQNICLELLPRICAVISRSSYPRSPSVTLTSLKHVLQVSLQFAQLETAKGSIVSCANAITFAAYTGIFSNETEQNHTNTANDQQQPLCMDENKENVPASCQHLVPIHNVGIQRYLSKTEAPRKPLSLLYERLGAKLPSFGK